MRHRIAAILTILLLHWPVAALAAEQAPPPPTKLGPEGVKFYRLHAEMNTLLGELARLQVKYRTADDEKRSEIQLQWKDLMAKGEKLAPTLIEAAKKAYAEAPNTDLHLAEYLVRLLGQKVQEDDFELAAEIGKLLMDHKCLGKPVPNWAGIAAFAVSDIDAAEKAFGQAEKDGYFKSPPKEDKLAPVGQLYSHSLEYYRKAWETEKAIREREAKDDDLPRVLLKTSKGDIELELFENEAPNTVKNFIYLVQRGFYDGLTFHRVLPGFMAQGGDPKGNGSGGPGYTIPDECRKPDHRLHFRGSLSMAKTPDPDTGGSQFFLTFVPTQQLDGLHTVFGRVVGGMDVLAKIQRRNPEDKEPARPDKIIEAKVIRKRAHEYVPKKMPQ